jgi:RNA polymerase sigma factor (sigma-70 family)
MAGAPFHLVVRHLRRLAASQVVGPASDGELLRRYAAHGDEAAFEELLRRHGPMVLQVGRRLLRHGQDAEDIFQATFLTLARKAPSIQKHDSVGCWLHGVARCLALRVRTEAARRRAHERLSADRLPADPLAEITLREARAVLDEELDRLSEALRAPLVLCYLEGLTQDEAARQLGWSTSTLRRRLEKGRQLLCRRLARRGVTLSAVLLPALLAEGSARAGASAALTQATLQAASSLAAGGTATGVVSARVAALLENGPGVVALARWKIIAVLLAAAGICAAGAGLATREEPAGQQAKSEQQTGEGPAAKAADQPKPEATKPARTDYYGDPLPEGVLARLGTVQLRHQNAHITFSADGKTLMSAGMDGAVQFWGVATGRQVRRQQVSQPGASIVVLSPDGRHLAGWGQQAVYLHDMPSGKELHRLQVGLTSRESLAFSPDGKTLATMTSLGGKSSLRLWDVATGTERAAVKKDAIYHFAFSPDGKLLVLSADRDQLCLCDTATGAELRRATGGAGSLAFAPDGKMVAALDQRGTVILRETATLKDVATLKPVRPGWQCQSLAYSPDGTLLAVAGEEDLVLWDVAARKERKRLPERKARDLAFSPDRKMLACAGAFEIQLWDVAKGERHHPRPGHDGDVWSVAVSPDGKAIASAAWSDPAVHLWDAATGKPLGTCPLRSPWVRSCAFTADGKVLVAGGDGTLRLVTPAGGEELRRFAITDVGGASRGQEVLVAHLPADGRRLAAISTSAGQDGTQLSVWDARTGESLARRRFRGFLGSCFTPDGRGVTVKDAGLVIEDAMTGRERTTIPGDLGQPATFSPDGQLIAVGIHKTNPEGWQTLGLRVAEVASGKEVFHVDGEIAFTAFSADGRMVVTADPRCLRLWDALTGQQLFRRVWPEGMKPERLTTPIGSLAILPNGQAVATGMPDGTVLVWNLAPETWPAAGSKKDLGRQELDRLWSDLTGEAGPAHRAIAALVGAPGEAVPFLAKQLQPVAAPDPEQVRRLLADLDSERFAVREAAARELSKFGEQIEPALRRVLQGQPSADLKKQVETLLGAAGGSPPAPTLRMLRAIRVLEGSGMAEARRTLEKLATGDPAARVTREAAEALERLKGRTTPR